MFRFNYGRTVQAVAYMLRDEPSRRLNYMRLIKLLYMADRKSLAETGAPITGDAVYAMDRGTVLSSLYDLIMGRHRLTPDWSRFFRRDRYELVMVNDPGNDLLSPYDAEKLEQAREENENLDEFDVANKTHGFLEWKKNEPAQGSSKRIPAEDILEALGYTPDEQDRIKAEARADHALARILSMSDACSDATGVR